MEELHSSINYSSREVVLSEPLKYVIAKRVIALHSTELIIVQSMNGGGGKQIEAAYWGSTKGVGNYFFAPGK